jgi:transcriptional regulator with XRE-family HTH domain
MITGEQTVIARRLLGWSLMELSSRCGVSDVTIDRFEKGQKKRYGAALDTDAIQRALEAGGVEFTRSQPSVKLAMRK